MAASKPMLEEGISTQASVCWREHEIRFTLEGAWVDVFAGKHSIDNIEDLGRLEV